MTNKERCAKNLPALSKASPIGQSLGPLIEQVRTLVQSARRAAAASVNSLQVLTNFEIGRLIVEHEQLGQDRAACGKETLKRLAVSLTEEFGRGFSERNLEYMRKFFLLWKESAPQISQKPSAKLPSTLIGQTLVESLFFFSIMLKCIYARTESIFWNYNPHVC